MGKESTLFIASLDYGTTCDHLRSKLRKYGNILNVNIAKSSNKR